MSSPPWRMVFCESFSEDALSRARAAADVRILASCDEQSILDAMPDCHALVVRTASRVTSRIIESAPKLRVIGRGGVGLDNIDLDAARHRGIAVVYTPDASTDAVADLTMALLLGLTWNLAGHNAAVRSGQFEQARGRAAPRELAGLKFGIVGMGRIGRAVARRAVHGFLMEVLYIDIADVGVLDFPARRVQPDELWTESDVVSLHVPLTSQTRQMIDRTALDQMKPSTVLINTSRGAVVDAPAVAEALRTGRLAGAGFDVFDHEPPPVNHPLLAAPNTLLTPHVGAKSERARKNMEAVVDDVICVLEGRPVRGLWVP